MTPGPVCRIVALVSSEAGLLTAVSKLPHGRSLVCVAAPPSTSSTRVPALATWRMKTRA
jgi:hypothetical protein